MIKSLKKTKIFLFIQLTKTSTQSLKIFNTLHCHVMENFDRKKKNNLLKHIKKYNTKNKKKNSK